MIDFLRQWNYTDAQLARIASTLEQGKTVRTTHQPDIEAIYPSDNGYTVVTINENGKESEEEFDTL